MAHRASSIGWLRSVATLLAEISAPSPARMARARSDLHHGLSLPAPACIMPLERALKALGHAPKDNAEAMVMLGRALRRMAEVKSGTEALQYRARAVAKLQEEMRRRGVRADFDLHMAFADAWAALPFEDSNSEMALRQHLRQLDLREAALRLAGDAAQKGQALLAIASHHAAIARHPAAANVADHCRAGLEALEAAERTHALDADQLYTAQELQRALAVIS